MRRTLAVPIFLAALTMVAACTDVPGGGVATAGGPTGSGRPSPTAGTDDRATMVHFAQCMREHGQDVPDPDPNTGELRISPAGGDTGIAWGAAMKACQQYLPNGGAPQAPSTQELEQLRQFARCMRGHGIEVSDPDPATGKSQIQGRLANAGRTQIENDPAYAAAQDACKEQLPQAEPSKVDR
jgi:hypothetical protein